MQLYAQEMRRHDTTAFHTQGLLWVGSFLTAEEIDASIRNEADAD